MPRAANQIPKPKVLNASMGVMGQFWASWGCELAAILLGLSEKVPPATVLLQSMVKSLGWDPKTTQKLKGSKEEGPKGAAVALFETPCAEFGAGD